ncbi:hypothetical protein KP509_13G087600 [Ceratopteris richardii]|uniref:Uncharacterized protein n=1 Tax=Ceratopteris richardii TaxID=49495 RepID=A0A8T2TJN1_CERRI|nr:hypothetical protein KP509_13G087600 [Ceratopteris richardii]
MGFDAAVCHCQREQEDRNRNIRRDFPAASYCNAEGYTYVDVILHKRGKPQMLVERIIVDVRFRDEFKIARPTAAYAHLLKALPATYVGTSDTLRRILKLMSMAMQKSMEEQGMPLPPWRTFSFLESKWLSRDYSRTVLPLSNHAGNPTLRFAETISSTLVASRTEDAAVAVKPNFPSTTQNPCCQLPNPGLSKDDRNFNSTNCGNVLASHLSSLYKENGNTSYGDRLSPSNEQETLNRLQKSWKLPLISVQFPYHTKGTRKRVGALTMALKHASSDEITVCNRNAISYGVVSPAIFC